MRDYAHENHVEARKLAFARQLVEAIDGVRADFADLYFTEAMHDAIIKLSGDDRAPSNIDLESLADMICEAVGWKSFQTRGD